VLAKLQKQKALYEKYREQAQQNLAHLYERLALRQYRRGVSTKTNRANPSASSSARPGATE